MYNKRRESVEGDFKTEDDLDLIYGKDVPVTRVEIEVNTDLALSDISNLQNKFKNLKIHRFDFNSIAPIVQKQMANISDDIPLFLDSVRFRGKVDALKRLPDHKKARCLFLLDHGLENILEDYNKTEFWQYHWKKSLKQSGLLSD